MGEITRMNMWNQLNIQKGWGDVKAKEPKEKTQWNEAINQYETAGR